MIKKLSFYLCLMVLSLEVSSQQAVMFSQYFINDVIYNPAISGSKDYNQLTIQTRQQWLGFEGAPLSANISYHGALNNRSAMGGFLDHDRTSPSSQSNLQINYAYHVPLNYDRTFLSFGIGAKFMYYNLDFQVDDLPPGNDPAFSSKAFEDFLGDVSSGIYLYNDNLFMGYSVVNMLQSSFNDQAGYDFSRNVEERVYYGILGYRFQLDRDWAIEPSVFLRHLENSYQEYNLSTRVLYSDQIWTAISARSNSSLSFSLGTNSDNVQFAYSFDHYFGEISHYQNGTHEITISFRVPNNNKY